MQGAQVQSLNKELDPRCELRVHMTQLRMLCAATKTQCSQINKIKKQREKEKVTILERKK